jgi:hypothetical protein
MGSAAHQPAAEKDQECRVGTRCNQCAGHQLAPVFSMEMRDTSIHTEAGHRGWARCADAFLAVVGVLEGKYKNGKPQHRSKMADDSGKETVEI